MAFVFELRVRYNECDAQGIVFNANWFTYFDVANTELWRPALGSYGALADHGCDVVVVEAGARFLAPAHFDDLLAIEVAVTRLGTTSMTTRSVARREGRELVRGTTAYVFVDPSTLGKTAIPAAVRAALGPFQA
jgi:acyl-CoA thioester hydrolase